MYRLILSIVVALFVAGCGSEKAQTGDEATATPPADEPVSGTGTHMLPGGSDFGSIVFGVFADEAAGVDHLAVRPGDTFDIYVMAIVEGPERVAAAQYRVVVPEGITLFAERKIIERSMTIGDSVENFSVAFQCQDPGIVPLMRYTLKADPDFAGGEVALEPGIPPGETAGFRGIVTCPDDGQPLKAPADAQPLVLTVK